MNVVRGGPGLGTIQASQGDYFQAVKGGDAFLNGSKLAVSQSALEKKDYDSAVQLLTKYLAAAPKDPIGHFQLGYAYTALDQWKQAEAEYRQAIALDPKLAPAQLNLGLVLLRNDPAAAVEPLRQAAALSPNDVRPQLLLAMALERSGQLADAAGAYRAAVKIDPKNFDSHYELARILLALKQPAEAEPEFREALALVDIRVLDHIVVGDGACVSFAERGLL